MLGSVIPRAPCFLRLGLCTSLVILPECSLTTRVSLLFFCDPCSFPTSEPLPYSNSLLQILSFPLLFRCLLVLFKQRTESYIQYNIPAKLWHMLA